MNRRTRKRPDPGDSLLRLLSAESRRALRGGRGLGILCLRGPVPDAAALLAALAEECDAVAPLGDGAALLLLPGAGPGLAEGLAERVLAAPGAEGASVLVLSLSPDTLALSPERILHDLEKTIEDSPPAPGVGAAGIGGSGPADSARVTPEEKNFLFSSF